eukprot:5994358-Alexandrium_andersonii.AAC.1
MDTELERLKNTARDLFAQRQAAEQQLIQARTLRHTLWLQIQEAFTRRIQTSPDPAKPTIRPLQSAPPPLR